ncbi:MAG: hypothetical protein PHD04_02385 [Candidatus Pacebacteria bacterium]|nr:hypothetical protein [Candidatus Paceibacterota bacterium]
MNGEGMELPGRGKWFEEHKDISPDFHLDPSKEVDPTERLVEKVGPEGAFDELMERLEQNPNDEEARRQANLLVNRFEDLASRLRGKVGH